VVSLTNRAARLRAASPSSRRPANAWKTCGTPGDVQDSGHFVSCGFHDDQRHRSRRPVGQIRTIGSYVLSFRETRAAPAAVAGPPRPATWPAGSAPTRATWTAQKKPVLEHCPHLDASVGHVTQFAKTLIGLHGDRLDD
jgi:hypothetical protein